MDDRRVFARINKSLPVRFLDPSNGREGTAETVDISANGLGIVGGQQLSANTRLEIWLDLPNNKGPLYTRGEVVWSSPSSESAQAHSGIRLEKAELMGLAPALWG